MMQVHHCVLCYMRKREKSWVDEEDLNGRRRQTNRYEEVLRGCKWRHVTIALKREKGQGSRVLSPQQME